MSFLERNEIMKGRESSLASDVVEVKKGWKRVLEVGSTEAVGGLTRAGPRNGGTQKPCFRGLRSGK